MSFLVNSYWLSLPQQGLKREDTIISLGTVNSTNHDSLKGVAALVGQSEGVR